MAHNPLSYLDELNFNTRDFAQTSYIVETLPEKGVKQVRICRCWQSDKFPLCDDKHKLLIENGDNVGPFVAKIPDGKPGTKVVSANLISQQRRLPVKGLFFAAAGGWLLADALLKWGKSYKNDQNLLHN